MSKARRHGIPADMVEFRADFRIGIDLGGTKAEIAALAQDGRELLRRRVPTPRDYQGVVTALATLVLDAERELGGRATVGIGIPGAMDPATGLVKNASSTFLIGHPLDRDIGAHLGREVRIDNDANCFTLSEAVDGAATQYGVVFGVILGTGCGGGLVIDRRVISGRHRIAGEWGHNPLPWPTAEECPGNLCWCGQRGCLETYISGTGLAADCDGPGARDATRIPARAAAGEPCAVAALERHAERVARGLAHIVNVLDPDAIVLGGGLSNLDHLYTDVPRMMPRYVFNNVCTTPILKNRHGDSSGVRGAAWLWPAGQS